MNYKKDILEKELGEAPILLQFIAHDFEKISKDLGINPTVTRILGKIAGDSGVHAQYCAIDFRNEFLGKYTYTKKQAQLICDYINIKYVRLDGKVTCIHHSFKGNPYHFHIQIPWNSVNVRGPMYNNCKQES